MKKASLARLLRPELSGLSAYEPETARARILLDANESPYAPSPAFRRRMERLVGKISLNRYPDPSARELKEKLRRHFGVPKGMAAVLGNGSDEIIQMLCAACAGNGRKRPRLAVPMPTFSMFAHIGKSLGWDVLPVPLSERFDLESSLWKKALRKEPNLVFLASPNNPTGNAYDSDVILEIVRKSRGLVIVDEAYGAYADGSFVRQLGRYPNLLLLKTLSKVGFAALRLGVAFGNQAIAAELEKVRLPYNVSTFSQQAAALYLANPAEERVHTRLLRRERGALYAKMGEFEELEVFPTQANFILFRTKGLAAAALHGALLRRGIRIRNLSRPGPLLNCLRVTIGTPEENRAFLGALRQVLGESRE
ncbi:MAG: histidinol-phosphate transaminase [Bdellovibrionota bacterium]